MRKGFLDFHLQETLLYISCSLFKATHYSSDSSLQSNIKPVNDGWRAFLCMGKQTCYEIILSLSFFFFFFSIAALPRIWTTARNLDSFPAWQWWRVKLKMSIIMDDWPVPLMQSQTMSVSTSALSEYIFIELTALESCDNDSSSDAHSLSGTSGVESRFLPGCRSDACLSSRCQIYKLKHVTWYCSLEPE